MNRQLPALLSVPLAALTAAVLAAAAGAAQPTLVAKLIDGSRGSTARAFARWNDSRSYYLTDEGGFENGGAGWTMTGAKVVSGNEPFHVNSASDSSSLLIPSGGLATSPSLLSTTISQVNVPVGTKSIQLQLTAAGDVQLDDIYIDPFASR